MTVGVLHDRVPPDPSRDELDTLVQVEAVSRSLNDLGYSPVSVEFHYDIDAVIETIGAAETAGRVQSRPSRSGGRGSS